MRRIGWITVVALVGAALTAAVVLVDDGDEIVEPVAPFVDAETGAPGRAIADGLVVAEGSHLLGRAFPLDPERDLARDGSVDGDWIAFLDVTGDPAATLRDYAEQLRAQGFARVADRPAPCAVRDATVTCAAVFSSADGMRRVTLDAARSAGPEPVLGQLVIRRTRGERAPTTPTSDAVIEAPGAPVFAPIEWRAPDQARWPRRLAPVGSIEVDGADGTAAATTVVLLGPDTEAALADLQRRLREQLGDASTADTRVSRTQTRALGAATVHQFRVADGNRRADVLAIVPDGRDALPYAQVTVADR